jgi:hypothetical protein
MSIDMELLNLLSQADRQLEDLICILNISQRRFIHSMHVLKETTQSSKIEATKTTLKMLC